MGPGLSEKNNGKSFQNSPIPILIFWSSISCVFCLYIHVNVVCYYDLSVLSISVMVFQKKFGWGGWVSEFYPVLFRIFFNFAKPLKDRCFSYHSRFSCHLLLTAMTCGDATLVVTRLSAVPKKTLRAMSTNSPVSTTPVTERKCQRFR